MGSKLFELADLYRIPGWMVAKASYAFAPISLLFRIATMRGTLDAFRSPLQLEALETLGRDLDVDELRLIARRHLEFRRRARLARLWPQIRDFTGADSIEVEGLHHLDKALAGGKGAILISAHHGYTRLIKPILASRGRDALLVGPGKPPRPPANPPVTERDRTLTSLFPPRSRVGNFVHTRLLRLPRVSPFEERSGIRIGVDLPTEINLRPHLAALARNETLIILGDGLTARALWRFPVLGIDVNFSPGAVSVARATGAPALPTFVVDDLERKDPVGLRLVIHRPLDIQVTSDPNGDHKVNLRRFAAAYEDQARTHPHLWYERRSEWEVKRLAFPAGFARYRTRRGR